MMVSVGMSTASGSWCDVHFASVRPIGRLLIGRLLIGRLLIGRLLIGREVLLVFGLRVGLEHARELEGK